MGTLRSFSLRMVNSDWHIIHRYIWLPGRHPWELLQLRVTGTFVTVIAWNHELTNLQFVYGFHITMWTHWNSSTYGPSLTFSWYILLPVWINDLQCSDSTNTADYIRIKLSFIRVT